MLLVFTATLFCDLEVPWVYGFPAGFYRPIKTRDLEKLEGIPHSAIPIFRRIDLLIYGKAYLKVKQQ